MKKIIDRIPESYGYKNLAQNAAWVNDMSLYECGKRYAQNMSFLRFKSEAKQQLFSESAKKAIEDYDSLSKILKFFESENVYHLVDRILITDLMIRMPDHLLAIVDSMCMAHSLESRSPLIDYKVVEYVAGIPSEMKFKGKNLKYILKKVAELYLSKEPIYRKKQGFSFPLGVWVRTDLKNLNRGLFSQSRFVETVIFSNE
jgi:asparagine synthase (glutamine-hydrolysing)